jgi:hypothetical protein
MLDKKREQKVPGEIKKKFPAKSKKSSDLYRV